MKQFTIYERDREYARCCNDNPIGTVYADTKEEAEEKARAMFHTVTGPWAVETKPSND